MSVEVGRLRGFAPLDDPRRQPPDGYNWPGPGIVDEPGPHFWLEPQPGHLGATPLFIVVGAWLDKQTTLAERCYRRYGVMIVNALRAARPTE